MALRLLSACTSLPGCVTMVWRGLPTVWRGRHRLLLGWLLCRPAVSPGRQTWAEMARGPPATRTAWRCGRRLTAPSGTVHLLGSWVAPDRVAPLPPPTQGGRSLLGDGRHADPRGPQHPVGPQGRLSPHPPGCVGRRCVRVMAAWDGSRGPGSLRIILPHRPAAYRRAHGVWRDLGEALAPPSWAQRVRVGGEAAAGSKATRRMVHDRAKAAAARRWGCGVALARPWKTVEEPSITHRVPPGPQTDDPCPRVARAPGRQGRQTLGT